MNTFLKKKDKHLSLIEKVNQDDSSGGVLSQSGIGDDQHLKSRPKL